ncbi:MAG: tRNA (uridine(34)/cytosine(34)/5-carboxymethylaminomethyluridine(34)-2'-O)-methyltransferase TrmL [Spirochaetota bacterium]
MALHIVLVEPEIPQNTGNIARTCAAVGATLHLVHPLGFSLQSKYLKRAGLDYWNLLSVYEYHDLEQFLSEHGTNELFLFTTKAQKTYCEVCYPSQTFLVFGKETKGLPESLIISRRESAVRIPMIAESRSLNLSNAVAVAAFECLRQHQFPGLTTSGQLHENTWEEV